tara:strand:+ start:9519 stop:10850 length:1332 start_codon:yes stop_codon:yes gene_type:complete
VTGRKAAKSSGVRWHIAALGERIRRAGVLNSIGILVSGTAAAHAITALAMPVVTRLFTPADFAAAAAFSSLVGILVVAVCLRFEVAIPLPEDDAEAANLLALSAGSTVLAALVAAVLVVVLPDSVLALLGQPTLIPYLWLLPIALLIGGLYLALQMWFVRRKAFCPIARSRIVQSTASVGGQLGLGWAGLGPLGLLVGQVLNYGAGAITLGIGLLLRERPALARISLAGMARAARIHHRFPRYSVWEALANAASIHLPILLIAAMAIGPEAGYLTLAIFLLQAPMALVGNAVGQVYLSGAPEAHRQGQMRAYTLRMIWGLAKVAALPILALALLSPFVFGLVFGEAWVRAGVLVVWMAPWFFLQFVSSPVSMALNVVGAQSTAMLLQVGGLVFRGGLVLAAGLLHPAIISETYALTGAVFYATFLIVTLQKVGHAAQSDASSV